MQLFIYISDPLCKIRNEEEVHISPSMFCTILERSPVTALHICQHTCNCLLCAWLEQVMQFLSALISSSSKWGYWSTCSDYSKMCHENKCHNVGDDNVNYKVEANCYLYCDCYCCHFPFRLWSPDWLWEYSWLIKIWYSFALSSKPSDNALYIHFPCFEVILTALTFNCKTHIPK